MISGKPYHIKKSVVDKFGVTHYNAMFITDNATYTRCHLIISGHIVTSFVDKQYSVSYDTKVMCDPEDTFNIFTGQYLAFSKCLSKFESYTIRTNFGTNDISDIEHLLVPKKGSKSRWGSFFDHLDNINIRFVKTLENTCKTKDIQLKLPFA